ncbi:GPO family capsid scaffolding protein [Aeromonas hydrophila]|uniref:GPO family capsid scaffolding protein n=1 Tax=Aeromonas hydrophila TaxID=644 RepID=UPI00191E0EC1|nr:GPO family capsid scaffolding protein [Aeromonas hydrophila]MBL0669818.1 GPO family capsid scaffolding protein [Aeromonas hydrophila]
MPTPVDPSLRTGWVVIATEGETVDGRQISAQWIIDMAETYDKDVYCAQLWPEHFRWGDNMGNVIELKHEQLDGKETLFAVLAPTRDLMYQNSRGQYKFCSIEPKPNFTGTGRTYLTGLGVTDQPASTGTTMLRFSATQDRPLVGQSQPLDLSNLIGDDSPHTPEPMGLAQQFFRFLARHGDTPPPTWQEPHTVTDEEDDNMKDEQFTALNATLKSIGDKFDGFSAKLDALGTSPAPTPDPANVDASKDTNDQSAKQFKAFTDALAGIEQKFDALHEKIETFSQEAPHQRPAPLGGKDEQLKAF